MFKYKKLNRPLLLLFIFTFFILFNNVYFTYSATLNNAFGDDYLKKTSDSAGYENSTNDPFGFISQIIKVALSFLGVIFLILMIYGGYLWMTASGNEQQVEKAKDLIKAAIIGLVIVVSAYAISYFVMSRLGGAALK